MFLHGWGSDSRVFAGTLANFERKYRCVVIDFLGFGKSDIPLSCVTVEMQGGAVCALCNFLEIKKFHLLAHSYGGRVSISLLAKQHSRIISALLISPAGVKDKRIAVVLKQKIFKIRKKLTPIRNRQKLEKYYSADYKNASGVMREMFLHAVSFDQTYQLERIVQPVLIVRGKNDSAVTNCMVAVMKNKMKNCKLCEIDGDHFAFLQSVMQFSIIAKDFFCV